MTLYDSYLLSEANRYMGGEEPDVEVFTEEAIAGFGVNETIKAMTAGEISVEQAIAEMSDVLRNIAYNVDTRVSACRRAA